MTQSPSPIVDEVAVQWPGRKFCETAERNVAELAKWVKGKDDKQVASDAALAIRTLLAALTSPPKAEAGEPVAVRSGKYDFVLGPFVAMMEVELHANSGKGDRPGWLAMSREEVLLEIYYHIAKLQKAVRTGDLDGIREHAADVANMSMMVVDICGAWPSALALEAALNSSPEAPR